MSRVYDLSRGAKTNIPLWNIGYELFSFIFGNHHHGKRPPSPSIHEERLERRPFPIAQRDDVAWNDRARRLDSRTLCGVNERPRHANQERAIVCNHRFNLSTRGVEHCFWSRRGTGTRSLPQIRFVMAQHEDSVQVLTESKLQKCEELEVYFSDFHAAEKRLADGNMKLPPAFVALCLLRGLSTCKELSQL